jgi:hypothetical protein
MGILQITDPRLKNKYNRNFIITSNYHKIQKEISTHAYLFIASMITRTAFYFGGNLLFPIPLL